MFVPHQKDGLNARRRLAGDQFESLLLASGAKTLERKMSQRFFARCSPSFFDSLAQSVGALQSATIKVSISDGNDLLQPFATVRRSVDKFVLFAGRLIEAHDGMSHYVSIVPQRKLLGQNRVNVQAKKLLTQLYSGHEPTQIRVVACEDMFALVQ
jgi:hypothetical protein